MKSHRLAIIYLIAAASMAADLPARDLPNRASAAETRSAMTKVIHQLVRSSSQSEPVENILPETNDVVVLERLIVQDGKQLPEFMTPRETGLAKLLRTGTIKQHFGQSTTVRLWSSGDAGIVLSFRR